jgi:hypothetical protein
MLAPARLVGDAVMAKNRQIAGFIGLFSLLASGPAALADSPCYAGYRDTTAAERAKMTVILETVKSAMPPAPAGWQISSGEDLSVPQSLCQDFAKVPFDYGFSRYYQNVDGAQQKQKLFDEQAAIEAAAYKKKQPRLEAIQAKMEKVSAQQVAVIQKGDFAGAEKFNAEIAKLQAEYQQVADEGNDPKRMEALSKEMNRDSELTIAIRVNPMSARVPPEAKPTTVPAGAKAAYRWHVEDSSSSNDHALYHLGTWFKRPDGSFQPSVRQGAPFSAAHAITVEVTGESQRVTQALAAIDFAKIASTLK